MEGRLLNQYELVAQLGQGGMGVVYRARDRELGRSQGSAEGHRVRGAALVGILGVLLFAL